MNPWLFPWWGVFNGPLSGDVIQDVFPGTTWLSPQFEFNFAGNRKIEAEVVADVASFGKQIGILTDAVMELADGDSGAAVDRLKRLASQIEKVKNQHKDRLERRLKTELEQLKRQDPEALERLLDIYR
ncbi:MAG: hypothetical protein CSA50_07500 [Gammaproteobacteria bacterium]|nr:MAG: hypothetical protein CSA50_07500 [Gammaproteobacteria bacterium]